MNDRRHVSTRDPARVWANGSVNTDDSIIAVLPGTVKDVARATGRTPKSVYKSLSRLREAKEVYISGWRASGTNPAAVYAQGESADVPRPARKIAPRVIAVPIVAQAMASQPSSIWAYAQKL